MSEKNALALSIGVLGALAVLLTGTASRASSPESSPASSPKERSA